MTARTTSPVALIDGDFAVYYTAFLTEGEGDVFDFTNNLDGTIKKWTKLAGCVGACICLSKFKEKNFRHALYSGYKACRKGRELPKFIQQGYEHLTMRGRKWSEHTKVFQIDNLEADDVMGILATSGSYAKTVIVTVDKDLKTIPGLHYDPKKQILDDVSPMEAIRRLYMQWLTGDPTDSIPGLPGIGPKKAEKVIDLVSSCKDLRRYEKNLAIAVKDAYKMAGQKKAYWLMMGRLVKILTAREWDRTNKKIIPWEPPCQW
jgi:DNA polymerase-1